METSDRGVLAERKLRWLALALCLSGMLPIVYWHLGNLLKREHYHFLILLPLAAWMILKSRERSGDSETPSWQRPSIAAIPILFLSLAGLAAAAWFWSPWLGAVAGLLGLLSVILASGRVVTDRWLAVWTLLWLAIPLPFGLDERLIVKLRDVTTRMSSAVLDQIGVLHLTYANVIEVPSKPLFIADACSGIHSLYVLLAVALLAGLILKRGPVHLILLILCAFGLVLVENVLRIVIVGFALEYSVDLSEGVPHTVLGAVLFCVSVGLILSADQFLNFVLAEFPFRFSLRFLTRQGKRKVSAEKGGPYLEAGTPPTKDTVPETRFARQVFLAVLAAFPLLGVAQIIRMPDDAPTLADIFPRQIVIPELSPQALPETLNGMAQKRYQTIGRVEGDPFGKTSQQWEYSDNDVDALYSLDYPYPGAHDLCLCYELIGWKLVGQELLTDAELSSRTGLEVTGGPVVLGRLHRELYGEAVVIFSVSDSQGQVTAQSRKVAEDQWNPLDERFREVEATQSIPKENLVPPFVQYQCFAKSYLPISDEKTNELLKSYLEARGQLRQKIYGQ